MEQLVKLLKSVYQEQFDEVYDQIAEVLDLDTNKIGNDRDSKIDALKEAILEYEDSDEQEAIVNEIRLFFEEDDHDDDDEDDDDEDDDEDEMEEEKYKKEKRHKKERNHKKEKYHKEAYDKSTTQDGFRDAKKKNKKGKGHHKPKDHDASEDGMSQATAKKTDDEPAGDGEYNRKHSKAVTKKENYHISSSDIDVSEDVDAIFKGEELNEELHERAKTVFESAVVRKVNEKVNNIIEEYNDMLEEKVEDMENELVEKVDEYLNYVVNEWVEDNKLAIESGITNEMTESFMERLKDVLDEHYIEVPESKRDLVAEQQEKIDKLEAGLNEAHEKNMKLYNQLTESRREDVIEQESRGLSQMQKDKLEELVEGLDFDPEEVDNFRKKVNIIRENYFPSGDNGNNNSILNEESNLDEEAVDDDEMSSEMKEYLRYLERSGQD